MKKSTVMLWAIFGALLMGCSDEEIANVETSSRNAIGFNVLSNAAETRAIPTTPDNLTSTDFDVFAFTTDGTAFMGKVDTDFGHDGVKIVYKNGKWDYDDANDLRYWPTEALDFYAFNPGTVSEDMIVFYSWEATKDVQKISYTCMDEYGSGTTHANYDVMYAMAKGQTKDMNNGIVKFNFKHILSQVVFKAKTQYDNMQVDIDVIKIHNFKFAGAFTLPAAADGTGSWSSSDLAFPHAFTVVKNANITVNSNTEATDITTNTPMLNIPQELTAWTVSGASKTKKGADDAKQCYLANTILSLSATRTGHWMFHKQYVRSCPLMTSPAKQSFRSVRMTDTEPAAPIIPSKRKLLVRMCWKALLLRQQTYLPPNRKYRTGLNESVSNGKSRRVRRFVLLPEGIRLPGNGSTPR